MNTQTRFQRLWHSRGPVAVLLLAKVGILADVIVDVGRPQLETVHPICDNDKGSILNHIPGGQSTSLSFLQYIEIEKKRTFSRLDGQDLRERDFFVEMFARLVLVQSYRLGIQSPEMSASLKQK